MQFCLISWWKMNLQIKDFRWGSFDSFFQHNWKFSLIQAILFLLMRGKIFGGFIFNPGHHKNHLVLGTTGDRPWISDPSIESFNLKHIIEKMITFLSVSQLRIIAHPKLRFRSVFKPSSCANSLKGLGKKIKCWLLNMPHITCLMVYAA